MESIVQIQIVPAVCEENADAIVDIGSLSVGPVCHIEDFIYCKAPLITLSSDSTGIFLSSQVISIQSVTFWSIYHCFKGTNSLLIYRSSDYTIAITIVYWSLRKRAPAKNLNISSCSNTRECLVSIVNIKINAASLSKGKRVTRIRIDKFFAFEINVCCRCASGCRIVHLISQSTLAVFPIHFVVFEGIVRVNWIRSADVFPSEQSPISLWVKRHTLSLVSASIRGRCKPAKVIVLAFVIITALLIWTFLFWTHGTERPIYSCSAVSTFCTIIMDMATFTLIETHTFSLITLFRVALVIYWTLPARSQALHERWNRAAVFFVLCIL